MSAPPRIDPARQLPMRLGVLLVAYLIYRAVGDEHRWPSIFIGIGTLILGYAVVTYLTTRRDERSGLLQAGQTILGIGLILLGIGQLVVIVA
jgi:hypothetical protein